MNENQDSGSGSRVAVSANCDRTRIIEEALSEIERELQLRERCFPRWIQEGRISKIDARDRLERQKYAKEILQSALDSMAKVADTASTEQS
jgi:hypothetical protein